MSDLHAHYTGNIPWLIWMLIIAVGCIAVGMIVPGLGVLTGIGVVLFLLFIFMVIVAFIADINS